MYVIIIIITNIEINMIITFIVTLTVLLNLSGRYFEGTSL